MEQDTHLERQSPFTRRIPKVEQPIDKLMFRNLPIYAFLQQPVNNTPTKKNNERNTHLKPIHHYLFIPRRLGVISLPLPICYFRQASPLPLL
jgi:hypothetical protein